VKRSLRNNRILSILVSFEGSL